MSSVTISKEYSMEQSIVETATATSSNSEEGTTSVTTVNSGPRDEASSQPVTLLNSDEVHDIEGKLRCLFKLLQHPRRHLEEIQKTLNETLSFYQAILCFKNLPYNEDVKGKMNEGLKKMQIREDILIRVIAGEQSYVDVIRYHVIKRLENPSIYE